MNLFRYLIAFQIAVSPTAVAFAQSADGSTGTQTFDVSGRDGRDGRGGVSYSGRASRGQSGREGGDGQDGEHGQAAGSIDLDLEDPTPNGSEKIAGAFIISGRIVDANSNVKNVNQTEVEIGTNIQLLAIGGDGGRGGDGGNGEGGGKGSDGSDATRYSSGTSGGAGKRGGGGGNAGRGGSAARGGKIRVRMKEADTHLLMAVEADVKSVRAGKPSPAGSPGRGGPGGYGGDGGSSYSWTETESYTDSNGKRQSRTKYRSNPGGSDGPTGPSGSSGSSNIPGSPAENGKFEIVVIGDDGNERTYTSRYNLNIVDFEYESANRDGIFEPGERVIVRKLRIKNTGGMPTPAKEIVVFLAANEWVNPTPVRLKLNKVLQPGETYVFDEPLEFKISDVEITKPGDRLVKKGLIHHKAWLDAAQRYFTGFEDPQQLGLEEFQVTFPVEITPITALESMLPGEMSEMYFEVKNISKRDFGSLSDLKRRIALDIRIGADQIKEEDIVLVDGDGNPVESKGGFLEEVMTLKAGASVIIKARVGLRQNVQDYQSTHVEVDMGLGSIENPDQMKTRQIRHFQIRAAKSYRKTEGSKFLLITNHGTEKAEVDAWHGVAKRLGQTLDIWDVSLNGFLDFARALQSGDSTLLKDFAGSTIILLNNEFNFRDEQLRGVGFVSRKQFLEAAANHGINFYIVGGERDENRNLIRDYLIPSHEVPEIPPHLRLSLASGTFGAQHRSVSDFISRVKEGNRIEAKIARGQEVRVEYSNKPGPNGLTLEDELRAASTKYGVTLDIPETISVPDGVTEGVDIISVNKHHLWGKPKEEYLKAQAHRIQHALTRIHPDKRYIVSYNFEPELIAKGMLKNYRYGTIQIRKSLDETAGRIAAMNVDDRDVHDADFVNSEENLLGLMLASDFDDQLDILKNIVSGKIEREDAVKIAPALVNGILENLMTEQAALREEKWSKGLSDAEIRGRLTSLKMLSELSSSGVRVSSPVGRLFVDMIAKFEYYLSGQVGFWNSVLPFRRAYDVSNVSREFFDKFKRLIFGVPVQSGWRGLISRFSESEREKQERKEVDDAIAKRREELKTEYREYRRENRRSQNRMGRTQYSAARAAEGYSDAPVSTDAAEFQSGADRIFRQTAIDAGIRAQLMESARLRDLEASSIVARETLLVKGCRDLLKRRP